MALQGTLDTFQLDEVLRLVATAGKTGRLRVTGPGVTGSVWTRDGLVVASDLGSKRPGIEPVDVVFELLRLERGEFLFHAEEQPEAESCSTEVDAVLDDAGSRLSEWDDLKERLPSMTTRVRPAASVQGSVTLTSAEWAAITSSAGGRTVEDLVAVVGLGLVPVCRAVADLLDRDLLVEDGEGRSATDVDDVVTGAASDVPTASPSPVASPPADIATPSAPGPEAAPAAPAATVAPQVAAAPAAVPTATALAEPDTGDHVPVLDPPLPQPDAASHLAEPRPDEDDPNLNPRALLRFLNSSR